MGAARIIQGAGSWVLETDSVSLALTEVGGHMAPVRFLLGERWVSPYSLPGWLPDDADDQPPVMRNLRGDFFCFPFGDSGCPNTPHGDTANAKWQFQTGDARSMSLRLESRVPEAMVEKSIALVDGHTALYIEHRIHGVSGAHSYGHHAVLHLPDQACPVSTSSIHRGEVCPVDLQDEELGQRSKLIPGASVDVLDALPCRGGGTASLSDFSTLISCEEMLMVAQSPGLAWSAVVMDGYVWYSLKRTEDFPETVFWVSHGGRDFSPWDGVHANRLGVEDVCAYFADGSESSAKQPWADSGVRTAREFSPEKVTVLRQIQGVAPLPPDAGGGKVTTIDFVEGGRQIVLHFVNAPKVDVDVDWGYLQS